jgi:single-strand DNA-binding protein
MFHTIIIVGNLGRDPEMRYMPSGTPVTNFSVAVNRKWTNNDGSSGEEVVWFRISTFGKLAEICHEYLAKGRPVLVEGRMRPDENGNPRVWTGQDGEARSSFEVVAQTVRFLGRGETYEPATSHDDKEDGDDEGEEIPF